MRMLYCFLLCTGLLLLGKEVSAQLSSIHVCFVDDSYFRYEFNGAQQIDSNIYFSAGTSSAYGGPAYLTLDLTKGLANGTFKLSVINPYDNFCLLTDSFVCTGTAVLTRQENNQVTYTTVNGSFISYCDGEVANTGSWSEVATCKDAFPFKKPAGLTPADGRLKINGAKQTVAISPNPVRSVANITYTVKETGKVSVVIYNSFNQPVKTFTEPVRTPGNYTLQWDIRQTNGTKAINGVYRAVVTSPGGVASATILVTGP